MEHVLSLLKALIEDPKRFPKTMDAAILVDDPGDESVLGAMRWPARCGRPASGAPELGPTASGLRD